MFMQLREIATVDELRHACAGDGLLMWAAQGFAPDARGWQRVRAWRRGDAVAVASPYLSCRDRLAVHGPANQVGPLVGEVLPETGPTFRPIGPAALVEALADRVSGLEVVHRFGWMETARPTRRSARVSGAADDVGWLDAAQAAPVAELLAEVYPASYARPGLPGVRRWAGAVGPDGALAAVTADAWSSPDVGYVAGVASRVALRGRGYASAAFRLAVDTLVAEHGRVALMVAAGNDAAVGLYRRAGFVWRTLAAARVVAAPRAA